MAQGIRTLAIACAAVLLSAPAAHAQPTAPPPPPPSGHGPPPHAGGYGQPQPQPPEAAPLERKGWFAGFEIGFGSYQASDQFDTLDDRGAAFFGGHFGGMISPRLGLLVEFGVIAHPYQRSEGWYNDAMLNQVNLAIAAKYWASPKLWLKGGLASSHVTIEENGTTLEEADGGGLVAGIGYEFYRRGNFIVDGQLRYVTAAFKQGDVEAGTSEAFGLVLGFSWY